MRRGRLKVDFKRGKQRKPLDKLSKLVLKMRQVDPENNRFQPTGQESIVLTATALHEGDKNVYR